MEENYDNSWNETKRIAQNDEEALSPMEKLCESLMFPNGEFVDDSKNNKLIHIIDAPYEIATFGLGCYWGAESYFGAIRGVLRTRVGYSTGKDFLSNNVGITDVTEVVEICYDPKIISYKELLELFWNNHNNPITNKVKRKYMSAIFYHNVEQRKLVELSKADKQSDRKEETIVTEIDEVTAFHSAEKVHQKYYLQTCKDFFASLNIPLDLIEMSYVATKLNAFLAGFGDITQFLAEADTMGLTTHQRAYVKDYIINKKLHASACSLK